MSVPSRKWTEKERLQIIGMMVLRLADQSLRAGHLMPSAIVNDTVEKITILTNRPPEFLEVNREQLLQGLTF